MPPKKYNNEDERVAARNAQQQERRDLQRAEASVALRTGRPALYNSAAKAKAAWNEKRRLRRKSAKASVQQLTDTPAQSNDAVTDDQQPATEVQGTQELLADQLEELSILGGRQSGNTQEGQDDGLQHGQTNAFVASVAVASNVTEPEPQHRVEACVETEAEVESEHDSTAHLEPESTVLALPQTELELPIPPSEEPLQHLQDPVAEEVAETTQADKDIIEEEPRRYSADVFEEFDDDAYVEPDGVDGNNQDDDVREEDDAQQDTNTARTREQAAQEARQAAADHIHALASHQCFGHSGTLTSGEAHIRPKSLWDAAQHTDSLLQILPWTTNTTAQIRHRPLQNQKLPHIDQYANVEWKRLYGADDPIGQTRGQLSFKLSQDKAFRRLGGKVSLRRRWDVDSVMFRTTTLGVFNEGVELCFYPPFDRPIKQNPNVTFNGCKVNECKNHLLAFGGASMIR
ncbi:hypothetical protein KCV03_g9978, partial [Aureobasidium melanogenum]